MKCLPVSFHAFRQCLPAAAAAQWYSWVLAAFTTDGGIIEPRVPSTCLASLRFSSVL